MQRSILFPYLYRRTFPNAYDAIKLKQKFETILPLLNEKQSRAYLSSEALYIGRGGIKQVVDASGFSKPTIIKGIKEDRKL